MTNREKLLRVLNFAVEPLDDDELSRRADVAPRQSVNALCRQLAAEGLVRRVRGPEGKLVTSLASRPMAEPQFGHPTPSTVIGGDADREALAGSSLAQRETEPLMLSLLSQRLGVQLLPRRVVHPGGARVELDGASPDLSVIVECWAHQGPAKPAQRNKLIADAVKLSWIAASINPTPLRLLLCVSDEAAVKHLSPGSWQTHAIDHLGVQVEVVQLPDDVRAGIIEAQRRQFR